MSTSAKPAPVKWAQRNDLVFLSFEVQDVAKPEVTIEKDKVVYKGVTKNNEQYENVLNLFGEINPEESKFVNRERGGEFVLIKAESGPYWQRLLKENTKYHWLKIDFNRWKDDDESDDEVGGDMGGMGGMPGMGGMGGMPGMGGMGGMPGMGGMGGMPGMGGMGGGNFEEMMRQMGGLGGGAGAFNELDDLDVGDGKDSDDENIPDLEDGEKSEEK